jgi:hypothetical protein
MLSELIHSSKWLPNHTKISRYLIEVRVREDVHVEKSGSFYTGGYEEMRIKLGCLESRF